MNQKYSQSHFLFNIPTMIFFGCGEFHSLNDHCKDMGAKVAIALDPYFLESEYNQLILEYLKDKSPVVFHDTHPDPHVEDADQLAKIIKDEKCDYIIAMGGGSTIDTSKAAAILATNEGVCWDYCYQAVDGKMLRPREVKNCPLPIIAIPTTAGSGSEATYFGLVTNYERKIKTNVLDRSIYPKVSIVDPELTISLPQKQTAYTGIDVLVHALETLICKKANPASSMFALEAIRLVASALKRCVMNGADIEARSMMALASTYGGISIAHDGGCIIHDIGVPLSALYNLNHGASLAVCLSEVIRWTLPAATEQFAAVSRIFNPGLSGTTESKAAYALPDIFDEFLSDIGVTETLTDFGLYEKDIENVVDYLDNYIAWNFVNHPKMASLEDVRLILRACL